MKNLLIAGALLAFSGLAHSATINFDSQTRGDNAEGYTEQGVTFSTVPFPGSTLPLATALDFSQPLEGSPLAGPGTALRSTGDGAVIRADFNGFLVRSVSIDLGDNNADEDRLFLALYDANDNLLTNIAQDVGSTHVGFITLARTVLQRHQDLGIFAAYALFGTTGQIGVGGTYADNFSFEVATPSAVPIPAAAILFAPALLGFMGLRRKAKKQA